MISELVVGYLESAVATAGWFRVCATPTNPKPVLAVPPPVRGRRRVGLAAFIPPPGSPVPPAAVASVRGHR